MANKVKETKETLEDIEEILEHYEVSSDIVTVDDIEKLIEKNFAFCQAKTFKEMDLCRYVESATKMI
jgi:ferritin-like metal-binding protein YciE